jgi:hypothetical protein
MQWVMLLLLVQQRSIEEPWAWEMLRLVRSLGRAIQQHRATPQMKWTVKQRAAHPEREDQITSHTNFQLHRQVADPSAIQPVRSS